MRNLVRTEGWVPGFLDEHATGLLQQLKKVLQGFPVHHLLLPPAVIQPAGYTVSSAPGAAGGGGVGQRAASASWAGWPVQMGLRFSRKAAVPSARSVVAAARAKSWASSSRPSGRARSMPVLTASLIRARAM